MSDPTLEKTGVTISYQSSDGYRAKFDGKGGKGTQHRVTGDEVPPQRILLEAVAELARITALFGFEAEALAEFTQAQQRIKDWRESRKATGAPSCP